MILRAGGGVRLVPLAVAGIAQQLFSESRLDARGKWTGEFIIEVWFRSKNWRYSITMRRRWRRGVGWGGGFT